MVSFRLSEEEYNQFRAVCDARNARSLSQVARHAMHEWLRAREEERTDDMAAKLDRLERRIQWLSTRIDRLVPWEQGK
jgi:hypothetical protein